MGITAIRVDDTDAPETPPGAFEFYRAADRYPAGMIYMCPCGCGRYWALPFRPHRSPAWHWNGNHDKPTLSPNVDHIIDRKTHWNGWLRAGVWESCDVATQAKPEA